jgi:hypothetical protein
MMKQYFILAVMILLTSKNLLSQKNMSYKPGEKVHYSIHYGVITGGTATIEIKTDTLFGKTVWHSRLEARTTGLTDAIFRVLDIYESYIDPETQLPAKSIRNIREGRYRKYNEVLFDHVTRPDSAILTSDLTGKHITEKGIHDILSCFYWFRNSILPGRTLEKGEIITITTWFTDELYPMRLRYMGTDEVKTRHGRIRCYKFNPVTESGRLFKDEEGVSFWFSADKNYLPVKIRFDIFVGSFEVEMSEYVGLAYPLEVRKR